MEVFWFRGSLEKLANEASLRWSAWHFLCVSILLKLDVATVNLLAVPRRPQERRECRHVERKTERREERQKYGRCGLSSDLALRDHKERIWRKGEEGE